MLHEHEIIDLEVKARRGEPVLVEPAVLEDLTRNYARRNKGNLTIADQLYEAKKLIKDLKSQVEHLEWVNEGK